MAMSRILKPLVPPLLWSIGKGVKRRLVRSVDHYAYAPHGWDPLLPAGGGDDADWSTFVERERAGCQELIARIRAGDPVLPFADEMMKYVAFGYVLARAARRQHALTVVDYGGNLGEYLWIARALIPDVQLEYHCKELPAIAAVGRQVNPEVIWHTDDACLAASYDLVMFSGSLQYLPEWKAVLQRAAQATRDWLWLSDVPSVRHVPTFVITQRTGGVTNLQHLLNHSEVIETVQRAGLRLDREFAMGPHPPVAHAPEQPTSLGLLFRR